MAAGVRDAGVGGVVPVEMPVADGGDGTLDVLLRPVAACGEVQPGVAPAGGRAEPVRVSGPLGAPVTARLGWLDGATAVVELAEAAGLRLLPPGRLDPLRASTRGVGELIRA